MKQNEILAELALYTADLDRLLEDSELDDFEDRLYYLGHLAMCARFFMVIHLQKPLDALLGMHKIESSSYLMAGTRVGDKGEAVRQSWLRFSEALSEYIKSS